MGIVQNLEKILQARYGRDVRQAIHDSISDLNEIANTAQTSAKAYYEGTQRLAQTISGNVGIDDSTATLGTTYSSHKIENKTRTNLLNPTLGTITRGGITCTNNGDGTYTLNGTATVNANFIFTRNEKLDPNKTYKIVGCPSGGGPTTYKIGVYGQTTETSFDAQVAMNPPYGSAKETFTPNLEQYEEWGYGIQVMVYAGVTVTNLTFKPMLTTDLSATYDDFVAYSGNGELNANVAKLYKEIQTLKNAITELGGTV